MVSARISSAAFLFSFLVFLAFQFKATIAYDPALALHTLYYAAAAYCSAEQISSWNCTACNQVPSFQPFATFVDPATLVSGFAGYEPDNDFVVISFMGTSNFNNVVDDLEFVKTAPYSDIKDAKVHDGFNKAYANLQPFVLAAYDALSLTYPDARVLITGHSLGAAVATLAATDLWRSRLVYGEDMILLHFGSPRVGNEVFAKFVDSILAHKFRLTHYKDVVPHLPMRSLGFYHIAQEIYYPYQNSSLGYEMCDMTGEDALCSVSQIDLSIADHLSYLNLPISNMC